MIIDNDEMSSFCFKKGRNQGMVGNTIPLREPKRIERGRKFIYRVGFVTLPSVKCIFCLLYCNLDAKTFES